MDANGVGKVINVPFAHQVFRSQNGEGSVGDLECSKIVCLGGGRSTGCRATTSTTKSANIAAALAARDSSGKRRVDVQSDSACLMKALRFSGVTGIRHGRRQSILLLHRDSTRSRGTVIASQLRGPLQAKMKLPRLGSSMKSSEFNLWPLTTISVSDV